MDAVLVPDRPVGETDFPANWPLSPRGPPLSDAGRHAVGILKAELCKGTCDRLDRRACIRSREDMISNGFDLAGSACHRMGRLSTSLPRSKTFWAHRLRYFSLPIAGPEF